MKTFYTFFFLCFSFVSLIGQTPSPYSRVYNTLNSKCQNSTCHSATSVGDNLKFDGTSNSVYNSIFKMPSALYPGLTAKYEKLVKPQHPYYSFLLRKVAGAEFDMDLAIDTATEGSLMKDI